MSRRRNTKSRNPERNSAKPALVSRDRSPGGGATYDRHAVVAEAPVWETARIGKQGAGHPPEDASFEERLAPYIPCVDAVLDHCVAKLAGNVDVSFMKDDFARLISQRMIDIGLRSLVAASGAAQGSDVMIEALTRALETAKADAAKIAPKAPRNEARSRGGGRGQDGNGRPASPIADAAIPDHLAANAGANDLEASPAL